jgi:uncharacterized protein YdaU (DUF1376 family)
MSGTKRPWFAFYASDWLSSRNICLMTPEQRGGYIQLLCHAWLSDDCGLPDDDAELAILSGLNGSWDSCKTAIRKCFKVDSGRLLNPRLLKEKSAILEILESRSKAGKKGARKRWGGKDLNNKAIILPMAKNSHSHSQSEYTTSKDATPPPPLEVGGRVSKSSVSVRPRPKDGYA